MLDSCGCKHQKPGNTSKAKNPSIGSYRIVKKKQIKIPDEGSVTILMPWGHSLLYSNCSNFLNNLQKSPRG